jgi:hypothetical protein
MTDSMSLKQNAPNAVASLVLGILSIVTGCFFVGLVLGIIGMVLASNGMKSYLLDPSAYKNDGMLRAGKILSIVGIVLSSVNIVFAIISAIALGGSLFFFDSIFHILDF